ncbi:hypothetical protein ACFC18_43665 [Streptomyces sp. NPDC056121]|uniref:hypothetical protein n=1 Tax=Streptomyces sp. NPDC056121 TaxID=3345718 RepID=UPI0035D9545E
MTSADHVLDLIRGNPDVSNLLEGAFDFDISRGDQGEDIRLSSGALMRGFASDAAGGTYFLCGEPSGRQPVVYASSEGQAGLIADDLTAALEIIIGLPCWHDCLKFSGGGDVEAMQIAAGHLEQDLAEYEPDIGEHRARLADALSLDMTSTAELVSKLREAVARTEPDHVLLGDEGEDGAYESLFGTFLPSDNPGWR